MNVTRNDDYVTLNKYIYILYRDPYMKALFHQTELCTHLYTGIYYTY